MASSSTLAHCLGALSRLSVSAGAELSLWKVNSVLAPPLSLSFGLFRVGSLRLYVVSFPSKLSFHLPRGGEKAEIIVNTRHATADTAPYGTATRHRTRTDHPRRPIIEPEAEPDASDGDASSVARARVRRRRRRLSGSVSVATHLSPRSVSPSSAAASAAHTHTAHA